jgi:GntR family transcriptional regulator
MFRKPNPALGITIHVQLRDQILYAIENGALAPGSRLPGIRRLARSLEVNPNTVVRVYRDLEELGVIAVRHGQGAFVVDRGTSKARLRNLKTARGLAEKLVQRLRELGLAQSEVRRLIEAELMRE